jgi:hypothetical protein
VVLVVSRIFKATGFMKIHLTLAFLRILTGQRINETLDMRYTTKTTMQRAIDNMSRWYKLKIPFASLEMADSGTHAYVLAPVSRFTRIFKFYKDYIYVHPFIT